MSGRGSALPRLVGVAALVLLGPALAACSAASDGPAGRDERVVLDVLAASSLTEAFEAIEADFEASHPGVDVRLSLGSSAALAQQVLAGAPADVIATADLATMETVVDAGGAADPVVFASNELVLITPVGGTVDSVDDLGDPDTTFVTCVETAPCGALAERLLALNDVRAAPASLEPDVKAVVAKVLSGEVDAGLAYASDAVAAGDRVRSFALPRAGEEVTDYAVAVTAEADDATEAQQWVDAVLGASGRRVLGELGFRPPTS